MREAITEGDRAAFVAPAVCSSMPWRVRKVIALPDYRLRVTFVDGLSGVVDMSALVVSPDSGVFGRLRDPELFAAARVEFGAVTWPGELDLAPDAMHAAIKEQGQWKLA